MHGWEKAARGPQGYVYPWGDDPEPGCANYVHTRLHSTSTVGCFPGGLSAYGVEELSGNVWEWTRSLWGDYPYPEDAEGRSQREALQSVDNTPCVVRGGAFSEHPQDVCCAARLGYSERYVLTNVGFCVCVFTPRPLISVVSNFFGESPNRRARSQPYTPTRS